MFEPVKNFLIHDNNESVFSYDCHRGVRSDTGYRLIINDYCSNPDVYGIGKNDKIFLCQGKIVKNLGKMWELIGQAISNRDYCNYLYVFLEKEVLEKIQEYEQQFKYIKSVLIKFNIGLLVVNNNLQVEEVFPAIEYNAPKDNLDEIKQKILDAKISETVKYLKTDITQNLGIDSSKILLTHLNKYQPAYYIDLEEWQKGAKPKYFVKFMVDRVLVGITVPKELMEKGFKNRLFKYTTFPFVEYNLKDITNDMKNDSYEVEINDKTNEFSVRIPLNGRPEDFLCNYYLKPSQEIVRKIFEQLKYLIKMSPPSTLKQIKQELA